MSAVGPADGTPEGVFDAEVETVGDEELETLLQRVYVGGGFADADAAATRFRAAAVRGRGRLFFAREPTSGSLAGVVIVAPPTSPARRLAGPNEAELHLLGVAPECRNLGVGALLMRAALAHAKSEGYERMLLWTQPTMHAAHRLYERFGFVRRPERDWGRGARTFLVYVLSL